MAQPNLFSLTGKLTSIFIAAMAVLSVSPAVVSAPAQQPLFLTQPVRPIMMLNMSADHQLFFKLYDDYSDLDGDGTPDTTYMHKDHEDNQYHYYGYFDSAKCYTYDTTDKMFKPSGFADSDNYCNAGGTSNEWSGNFLNWATMTRMDAVRKILYGGKRSTDTTTSTVLERAFLPQDAHAFAKFYKNTDLNKLSPFGANNGNEDSKKHGITICNTTDPGSNRSVMSQAVTAPPLMQVARGNYSLWASNERWQCRWGTNSNDNNPVKSGIDAYSDSPTKANDGLGEKDYVVRVQACAPNLLGNDNNEDCKAYGNNFKPTGLLQTYGEDDAIHFGLMTGSYGKNKSGGVLRKNVGSISDEIGDDGTFNIGVDDERIIGTLERLRIYGYNFDDGTYNDSGANGDNCSWALSSFTNGNCSNWGNPQSEIFLESLRYLAGKSANFGVDDSGRIAGLNTASTWNDPINANNYCAPTSVIQFNASASSYDGDELSGATSLDATFNVSDWTNAVGAGEGIHGNEYFIGTNSTDEDQLCTPKTIESLASADGTCPDAPRLEGSYQIAGLAYYARKNSIRSQYDQKVRTYGVALAPAVPRLVIPVPGSETDTVTILPACRNTLRNDTKTEDTNCAIVDFRIAEQDATSGKLYVNWEDSEQGGDYDQDMWGVIDYVITASTITVTTEVIAQSTGDPMGFGYVISGTTNDGFHVHSGVNNFTYGTSCTSDAATACTCRNTALLEEGASSTQGACNVAVARSKTYAIGDSDAKLLEQPLYYAAKWGGYSDDNATADEIAQSSADSYFYATDPRELEASLRQVFGKVADSIGSASAVATNSTRLTEGSILYQARFNSRNWSGELLAYEFDEYGNVQGDPKTTNDTLRTDVINPDTRNIYSWNDSTNTRIEFRWDALSATQQAELIDGDAAADGQARLRWLRGASDNSLRVRESSGNNEYLLGDIINSSPAYLGGRDLRYDRLPGEAGAKYREYLQDVKRQKQPRLFVGANDGMLHAFDAESLEELYAYVPAGVYPKLANLTRPDYGSEGNLHQYLVDGPLAVGDVYLTVGGTRQWRSIVVGTLGAGGKGIFALDVTDDQPRVLFELNYPEDVESPLGFVVGQPFIVPLKNRDATDGITWAAVFGNGYEADSTRLYWVDLENPSTGVKWVEASDTGSGLSAPALLPNGQGIIEAAYAGDLDGNMWKFDLYSDRPNQNGQWSAHLLFNASVNNTPQPITAAPELGVNSQRDYAITVYFGTGKYLYDGDNRTDVGIQTVYAITDEARNSPLTRADLHEKSISLANGARSINGNDIDWTQYGGWYMDLPTTGERMTSKPILLHDKLIFTTLIPSAIPCQFGGSSWIMEVPAIGDKYVNHSILGGNVFNEFLILGEMGLGLIKPPPEDDEGEGDGEGEGEGSGCEPGAFPARIYALGSTGELVGKDGCLDGGTLGRTSWRQLQ